MSVIPYFDALVISGATMLLLHPRAFDYLSTYTASPIWTIFVIGVIIWCVSFITIGLRLKWLSGPQDSRISSRQLSPPTRIETRLI